MSWNEFRRFGDPAAFALDIRLMDDPDGDDRAPAASIGSWSQWRLWLNGVNLTRVQIVEAGGNVSTEEGVRWYIAPLLRWLVRHWVPLLHETRLPDSGWRVGGSAQRWARSHYLSMIEAVGDDEDRFAPWQAWGERHALRFAAEGGILPDVFFQRIGDEIEMSWGDRFDPGTEAATFLTEEGVSRTSVSAFGTALSNAIDYLLADPAILGRDWAGTIAAEWRAMRDEVERSAIHWYLDAQARDGILAANVICACRQQGIPLAANDNDRWIDQLAPAVAMFGDVSPNISAESVALLLAEFLTAQAAAPALGSARADELAEDDPAWAVSSPWDSGYGLALDVLEENDPAPQAGKTQLEHLLLDLGVRLRTAALGLEGPRGVALAGEGVAPTIIVNDDHISNEGKGRRFTIAHELCHILFDRGKARILAHSSTPWAPMSVEQRANAFAAMLLMPPYRSHFDHGGDINKLRQEVDRLAQTLGVSRSALRHHLANIGEINSYEFARLSRAGARNLH